MWLTWGDPLQGESPLRLRQVEAQAALPRGALPGGGALIPLVPADVPIAFNFRAVRFEASTDW